MEGVPLTPAEEPVYNPKPRPERKYHLVRPSVKGGAAFRSFVGRKLPLGQTAKVVPDASRRGRQRGGTREGAKGFMADRDSEVLLTAEGLRKLEVELEELKTVRRREVAERIKVAREFGDLSENSEYEAAKNEQAWVEGRVLALENQLRNARIVRESEMDPEHVNIGTTVKLKDVSNGEIVEYVIVGASEADPANSRISYQCPVGQAVLGKVSGATVDVRLPAGTVRYQILSLTR